MSNLESFAKLLQLRGHIAALAVEHEFGPAPALVPHLVTQAEIDAAPADLRSFISLVVDDVRSRRSA